MLRKTLLATAAIATIAASLAACGGGSSAATVPGTNYTAARAFATTTPIKHLVVIYQQNVSFDHYFATYPNATNPAGEPAFTAKAGTPQADTLANAGLLTNNPNMNNPLNIQLTGSAGSAAPFRLDRTQAATADQVHAYAAEQKAYDNGKMDGFPYYTGIETPGGVGAFGTPGQVMGYFDGNTVTALWNYAQNFAMSDDAFMSSYGPSTPGAFDVIGASYDGAVLVKTSVGPFTLPSQPPSASKAAKSAWYSYYINDGLGGYSIINDVDPAYDVCSNPNDQVMMTGKNIGDLLNAAGISWGGFMGGFDLTEANANGTTGCKRTTFSQVVGASITDYIPHHNWFQYFKSTANPTHARPSSVQAIGHSVETDGKTPDPANHEYSLHDFFDAVKANNMPAVAYLNASAFEDGHAGYSNPLDEQMFVAKVVNYLEQQPQWSSTAVVVTWDDSDGWYDHAYHAPTSYSYDPQADQVNGPGQCGPAGGTASVGINGKPVNGQCGPGTRLPFLVISPWAKPNYVSHTFITQAAIVQFIEDNWLGGQRLGPGAWDTKTGSMMDMFNFSGSGNVPPLYVDPAKGTPLASPPAGSTSPTFTQAATTS